MKMTILLKYLNELNAFVEGVEKISKCVVDIEKSTLKLSYEHQKCY